jgi:hypothetical protein
MDMNRYTFDGFGINDAHDKYKARIATFTKHGLACVPSAQDMVDKLNRDDSMPAKYEDVLPSDSDLAAAYRAIDALTAQRDALAQALRECITENGAMADRNHKYALMRLSSINGTVLAALSKVSA